MLCEQLTDGSFTDSFHVVMGNYPIDRDFAEIVGAQDVEGHTVFQLTWDIL